MRRPDRTHRLTFAFVFASTLLVAASAIGPRAAVAADITWIDAAGGNFNDPSNWSPAQVPDKADRALITIAGTYTVNVGATDQLFIAELVVDGSSGEQTLHFTPGGSIGVDTDVTIGAHAVVVLEQASSLLAFGAASIAGGLQASQATFDANEVHNTGTIELSETSLGGRFLNDGMLSTHGTCGFQTLENAGTFEALTGPGLFPGAFVDSLINRGHVTAGPSIMFVAGALMSNEPNGVLSIEASTTANANEFRNAGVWRVAAGSSCQGSTFVQLASGEFVPHYDVGSVIYPILCPDVVLDGTLAPVFAPAFTPPPGNLPLAFKQTLAGEFSIVSPSGTHGVAIEAAYLDQVYVHVLGPGIVITPPAGEGNGSASTIISGSDLSVVTQARLTRTGQTPITADPVTFDKDTRMVYATFDLTGRATGAWNVEVEGPGGTQTAPDLFTIETAATFRAPIRVDILGGGVLRRGGSREWSIAVLNPNGTDERGAVQIDIPGGLPWELFAQRLDKDGTRGASGKFAETTTIIVPDVVASPGITLSIVRIRLTMPVELADGQGTIQARWYQP
jgi:hypothetical protein